MSVVAAAITVAAYSQYDSAKKARDQAASQAAEQARIQQEAENARIAEAEKAAQAAREAEARRQTAITEGAGSISSIFSKFNDDFYTGSIIHIFTTLSQAMANAKSTDPVKVAAALEGLSVKSFNGDIEVRKLDHQLQQTLYLTVWQKAEGKYSYSPEKTGMTLAPALQGGLGGLPVDAVVAVEHVVFGDEDGVLEVVGNLAPADPSHPLLEGPSQPARLALAQGVQRFLAAG